MIPEPIHQWILSYRHDEDCFHSQVLGSSFLPFPATEHLFYSDRLPVSISLLLCPPMDSDGGFDCRSADDDLMSLLAFCLIWTRYVALPHDIIIAVLFGLFIQFCHSTRAVAADPRCVLRSGSNDPQCTRVSFVCAFPIVHNCVSIVMHSVQADRQGTR